MVTDSLLTQGVLYHSNTTTHIDLELEIELELDLELELERATP